MLGLTTFLLVTDEVVTRQAFFATRRTIVAIQQKALPSIRQVTAFRGDMRALRSDLLGFATSEGTTRDRHALGLDGDLNSALHHWKAYTSIAEQFPSEDKLAADLSSVSSDLRTHIDSLRSAPGKDAVLRYNRELVPRLDTIDRLCESLVELNASASSAVIRDHDDALDHASNVSIVVLLVCLGSLIAAGAILGRGLVRASRENTRLIEELDAFTGRVAHDLKNPVGAASMALSVLAMKSEGLGDDQKRWLERAKICVGHTTELIDGLLDFARAAARPEPCASAAVPEIAARVVSSVSAIAEREGVSVKLDPVPDVAVAAHAAVLTSILTNLIRNGILHMGSSLRREVVVHVSAEGGDVVLAVKDFGPGILPTFLPRLFQPFEKGSSKGSGHGLGLATVQRLVLAHRGNVDVHSVLGEGSTFIVRLPRAPTATAEPGLARAGARREA
jgi:signal transduction histidine kinase